MSLFKKKSIPQLLKEAGQTGDGTLKRSLTAVSLVALGVGVMVGAGLFSITGMAASNYAGPGIMISFIIAAIGCGLAGLCYAEFASMIPVAGSAYTYSYATMGEFVAWIIGWDLVLEYTVGAATVASSWSDYFTEFLSRFGMGLPPELTTTPFDGGIMDLPSVFIVVAMSLLLIRGTSTSAFINNLLVALKIGIIIIFVGIGFKYIRPENLQPLIPPNEGNFGEFGWTGVIRAAAIVFFAFLGFDAISTAAQETKNPKKAMPIGILGSLLITSVLYILFAYVMTGVAHYTEFRGQDGSGALAPVATAVEWMGPIIEGVPHPDYPWLNMGIIIAILLGFSSVILVMLLAQSRVFYSMSIDGLLPKVFSEVSSRFRTPVRSNLVFMVLVSLFAAFVPGDIVGEMVSIGTLFAFVLVCIGVLVSRREMPDIPRGFRVPFVPIIPILGVLVCLGMMVFLPFDTWIRLLVWLLIGLDIYETYGVRKSKLNRDEKHFKDRVIISICGLVIAALLLALAYVHHFGTEEDEREITFFYISVVIGYGHLAYYIWRYRQDKKQKEEAL